MAIPHALQDGIDEIVRRSDRRELERAARALSERYRAGGAAASRTASSPGDVAAYLATRAPATYAAVEHVCRSVTLVRPGWSPISLLDLGAGPGTASWAATREWPGIATVTLAEAEPEMVSVGKSLAAAASGALRNATWIVGDAGSIDREADLVMASYLVGEIDPAAQAAFVRAWALTRDTLVVVEPGTTDGYRRIIAARQEALDGGGTVLAPCPHEARARSQAATGATSPTRSPARGHTDSRRTPSAASRTRSSATSSCRRSTHLRPQARVIRRPDRRQGHVVLDLCTDGRLERRIVSKSDGPDYRAARKLAWGDAL